MTAIAVYWGTKLCAAFGSDAAAAVAGVPKGALTLADQRWGETCVYSLTKGLSKATVICLPQETSDSFDYVLSWEIMWRVVTGYYREPYF